MYPRKPGILVSRRFTQMENIIFNLGTVVPCVTGASWTEQTANGKLKPNKQKLSRNPRVEYRGVCSTSHLTHVQEAVKAARSRAGTRMESGQAAVPHIGMALRSGAQRLHTIHHLLTGLLSDQGRIFCDWHLPLSSCKSCGTSRPMGLGHSLFVLDTVSTFHRKSHTRSGIQQNLILVYRENLLWSCWKTPSHKDQRNCMHQDTRWPFPRSKLSLTTLSQDQNEGEEHRR